MLVGGGRQCWLVVGGGGGWLWWWLLVVVVGVLIAWFVVAGRWEGSTGSGRAGPGDWYWHLGHWGSHGQLPGVQVWPP